MQRHCWEAPLSDSAPLLFTSDINKFMDIAMNDDAAERAEALSGNKSDIALCEIVRFGVMFKREMAASVKELFQRVVLPDYSQEERRQLFMHIKGLVDNIERMSANALLPFILYESSTHIVSTAVIDYVAVGTIINNDPLGRAKDIVEFIRAGNITNVGAAFGGLLHFGDRRVCRLIWPLRDLLEPNDVRTAIQCTTGLIYAATVELEIDWLEELDGTIDDAVFTHLAAGLVNEVRTSQMNVVLTGPRVFPVPKKDLTEAEQRRARELANPVPLEEYANRIASRLYAIERTEPPPRIMPHVLTAWGLAPATDLSEALPVESYGRKLVTV
jgi:hypothetical protein